MTVRIGETIRALRKKHAITQEKLGEALGRTGQAIPNGRTASEA